MVSGQDTWALVHTPPLTRPWEGHLPFLFFSHTDPLFLSLPWRPSFLTRLLLKLREIVPHHVKVLLSYQ